MKACLGACKTECFAPLQMSLGYTNFSTTIIYKLILEKYGELEEVAVMEDISKI